MAQRSRGITGKTHFYRITIGQEMSKSVFLREAITTRLTAAAEEIFETVEKIIVEYQQEISRSKEENERLRKMLNVAIKPVVKLHRAEPQPLAGPLAGEDVLPDKDHSDQEWNPGLENLEPPQVKEEHYLCRPTSQQQPRELEPDFRHSSMRSDGGQNNSYHPHLHQTLTEKNRERDRLPTNTAGDMEMSPHGDPQLFSHSISEEEEGEPEQEWSPGLEQENLEPPHIKQEHDLWTSQEQQHLLSDQSPEDETRERDPLPTNPAGDIQIFPDGGDDGGLELTRGCSFWDKHMPVYPCKYCSKCCVSKDELNRHERLHTEKKPYHQCKYCGRLYIRKSELSKHETTHAGHDQNRCKFCGKRFTYTGDLNRHELVHTGIKPYMCTFCNKCFSRKSNLKRHELVHRSQTS